MKLNGQESKLNTNLDIHKSIMEAYAEINAVEQEISTELRDYTNSLNDEQKSQFAEVMFRSGYENFIMNNLDCFGESFKKQLGENLSISSMAKAYLDLLKEKNKTEISEDELKTFVELLKFK